MKVFVTGATGFVGSHVAQALAQRGAELRLLVRPNSRTENIDSLPAERVIGDLCDAGLLRKGMSGCELVFHVAADYRLWAREPAEIYRSNVEGTREVLTAAKAAGVRRVVHTSSVATVGFRSNGRPADEDSPVSLADMIGPYKRSKFMGEQVARDAARELDVTIVSPTTPVGERDIKPTPTGQVIVAFLRRKFPAYVDTGLNLVDVAEVALGHVVAAEKGRRGERYILGGENLTLKQILDRLSTISGLPSPRIRLPYALALATGAVDTLLSSTLLRREPRVVLDSVRMGRKKMYASSAKAERELGWQVVPVDDALRRAVEWFRTHGYA